VPRFAHLGFALAMALSCARGATAESLVRFPSAAPRADGHGPDIRGFLAKPQGAGPFPAVVLLHSCLGLPANRRAIETALSGSGYVALFVDDFASRGLKETCAVDFPEVVADAYGALAYLSRLPFVDPSRIAAVGFSQGADAALAIASGRLASAFALPEGLSFKAAAAFYPPCPNQAEASLTIPTLILIGAADDVTPAADCKRLASRQSGEIKLVIYPNARHGFDDPEFGDGRRLLGMTLAYDHAAAVESKNELGAFLAKQFGR
jgi:dienelactone hydrolase